MKLKDIQHIFHQELDVIYDKNEVDSFFFMLLDSFCNITRIELALNPELVVNDSQKFYDVLKRLKNQEPIQYIIGDTEFFGLPFKINQHVLIPRPETEELVDWILSNHPTPTIQYPTILDIGTGNGCIAISLAKNLQKAKVYALDVSQEALHVANENSELNEVKVEFIEADILKTTSVSDIKFDIIVSNPPYVRELEKKEMKPNVLNNEPHLALFVDDEDSLKFYKVITKFAVNNLKDNGMLFFEINEYLGDEMIQLLKDYHFKNIELKQDIFKKYRMIKGQLAQ